MRKIIFLIAILISTLPIFAIDGVKVFPDNASYYLDVKNKNILNEQVEEISNLKNEIIKYKSVAGVDIDSILSKSYEIAAYMEENLELNFIILRDMNVKEYAASLLANNTSFKYTIINGMNCYIMEGKEPLYYIFIENTLILSNKMELFSKVLTNLKGAYVGILKNNPNFQYLMSKQKTVNYRIFVKDLMAKTRYSNNGLSIFNNRKEIKKYYLTELQEVLQNRFENFSEFVIDPIDNVYLGRDTNYIIKRMEKDLSLFNYKATNEFKNYLDSKIKYFMLNEINDKFYFVFYGESIDNQIFDMIMREYEKASLYSKKLTLLKKDDFGYYFELPNIGIKRYECIVKDKYFVFSNDWEIMKNINTLKYSDVNYSKLDTNKEFDFNYKDRIYKTSDFKDKEIAETIVLANSN